MGEFDDHFANFGDWIPPSPSPTSKALFSSLVANDFEGWPPHVEETSESKSRNVVVETQEHVTWCNSDGKDGAGTGATTDQIVKSSAPSEQETSSRGGLMERRAARAGFNAPRLNTDGLRPPAMLQNQVVKSPYLSIAAGISPSVLLYSPDFLRNSLVSNNPLQVHPSPTSGVLPCASGNESNSVMLTTEAADKVKETAFEDNNASSLPFNPIMETGGVNPSSQIDVSVHPSNSLQPHIMEATENEQTCHETTDVPLLSAEEDVRGSDIMPEVRTSNVVGGSTEHSPSLDEKQDEDSDGDASVEDGYNWRKYGQNQVKGSEYPRSYYKCAHPNCFVKKEIARYHKGHVTEVIYNGAHNHPKPLPNWISALGSSNSLSYMQLDNVDPTGTGVNNQLALETIQQGPTAGGLEGKNDSLEATSLADLHSEYCRGSTTFRSSGAQLGSADANDISSTFSNNEVDHGTRGNVSLDCDDEGDESESKIRKIEHLSTDTRGTSRSIRERSIREPRIVVQTTSEVDVLDDGYRWRKYGQKVVKGNPNPRSYYKCTNPGCNVRKHVERAPFDPTSVITTYDGKHNHDIPAERSSNQANSDVSNSRSKPRTTNAQGHAGRTEPTQLQNSRKRYGRAPSFDPTSEFNSSGTNQQQCLIGHAMTGFNSNQHQFSAPAHTSGTNQQQGLTGHAMTGFNSDQHQFSAPAHTSGTNQQQGLTSHAMTRFNSDQHQFSAPAHSSETNQQQGLTGHAMTGFNSNQHQFSAPGHTSGTNQQEGLTGHAMTGFNSDQHQFSAPAHTSGTNQQQGLTSHAMTRFNSDQHQFSAPAHSSGTNQQQGLTGHAMTGFNSDQHQFSAPGHTSGTNQQEGLTGHAMTRFNSDQHQFSAPAHSSGTNQQQGLTGHAMTGFNSDQPQFSAPAHPFPGRLQPVSYATFVPPEGEPIPDPSLNYSNASSTYQQFMNGTPPGPQM